MAGVDRVLAGVTVTASLLSLFGTAFILVCYLILPCKQHIRHALIVNLTLADFINAANNSVSGLWVLVNDANLTDGPKCVANGFVGQLSVQAVDFSILAITIVTFWIVTSQRVVTDTSLWKIVLICASSWILPIITSCIALFNSWYHPVSGNWCWIQESPTYLRYVLTHGWRFIIIFVVSGLCIYIQIYLRRHLRFNVSLDQPSLSRTPYVQFDHPSALPLERFATKTARTTEEGDEEEMIDHRSNIDAFQGSTPKPPSPRKPQASTSPLEKGLPATPAHTLFSKLLLRPRFIRKRMASPKQHKSSIEKTMLLNAYPVFYILLWMPGLANRIAEATGHSVYALHVLQASTQLIGFANAVTFGWNERIGRHLGARLKALVRGRVDTRWAID